MKSAFLILLLMLGSQTASVGRAAADSTPLVFAHYMVYAPDSIDTYQQEMRIAQSKGIDAFALNTNVFRQNLFDNIYEAARLVGPDFKLFFSADIHADGNGRLSPGNIIFMLANYRTHPNQLLYNDGKAFFTTWLGDDDGFWSFYGYANAVAAWDDIFNRAGGKSSYYYVPFFPTDGSSSGVRTQVYNRFGSLVDGYYGWDTSAWNYINGNYDSPGTDPGDASSLAVSKELGKSYMASVSPWFFKNLGGQQCCPSVSPSCNPSASRDQQAGCPCQVKGNYQGPGLWMQRWSQLLANPPPLVQIVSWNDWVEGHYVGPGLSVGASSGVDVGGFPHEAYLDLGKHYIDWYKTGSEPFFSKDSVYLFYYTQSKNFVIGDVCNILNQDKLSDSLYAVVKLSTGPDATVTLNSGGVTTWPLQLRVSTLLACNSTRVFSLSRSFVAP